MNIVFIGAGNVATQLAIKLHSLNITISQVYSRTIESAKELALKVDAEPINDLNIIKGSADIYIFSVKDSVLTSVINNIAPNKGLWIHTSGSMPLDVFKGHVENYGILYPLQTFSKQRVVDWSNIPIFLESSKLSIYKKIETFSRLLSHKHYPLSSKDRQYIHTSAVFANNFSNHMFELAAKILKNKNIPYEVLLPLIDETCAKIHDLNPHDAQTGPAIRFDENVMDKHLQLIEDEETRSIYKAISNSIHNSHK